MGRGIGHTLDVLRVGLTGGIGAGKSTVAGVLTELGALVVDADRISREVVEPGTDGLRAVVEEFGDDVLDADGALDRPRLGQLVFGDDARRQALNGILHPRIGARTAELIADAPHDAIVVHDVPLLVENDMGAAFALVLVVDAPVDVRIARLRDARGMSAEDARSRIAAQADVDARRAAADVWIDNAGPVGVAREVVEKLWRDRIVPFEAAVRAGRTALLSDEVVAPAPTWPAQACRLAARVALAGGTAVTRVEHVGPTAVDGLAAPDVVDLLVLTSGADPEALAAALAAAGFPPAGRQGHRGADPARPVRLHVRPEDSPDAADLLARRDAARGDPERVASAPAAVRAELLPHD